MPNKFTVSQMFGREEKTNVFLEIKEVWKLISYLGDHVLQFIGLYPHAKFQSPSKFRSIILKIYTIVKKC